jgi:hypothetical protein
MTAAAPCQSARSAAKTTSGIPQAKTRAADVCRVFPEDWAVLLNASTHRNDATKRFHRYASADRGPVPLQRLGYLPRLGPSQGPNPLPRKSCAQSEGRITMNPLGCEAIRVNRSNALTQKMLVAQSGAGVISITFLLFRCAHDVTISLRHGSYSSRIFSIFLSE